MHDVKSFISERFPKICKLILMHGVISLPIAMLYDKIEKTTSIAIYMYGKILSFARQQCDFQVHVPYCHMKIETFVLLY